MSNDVTQIPIEEEIVRRIQAGLATAEVQLRDMTGTRDHWEAVIISSHFEGARLIARQQAVYRALGELMAGPIHAFTMTTLTPAEAIERGVKINSAATSSHDEGSQGSGGLVTLS